MFIVPTNLLSKLDDDTMCPGCTGYIITKFIHPDGTYETLGSTGLPAAVPTASCCTASEAPTPVTPREGVGGGACRGQGDGDTSDEQDTTTGQRRNNTVLDATYYCNMAEHHILTEPPFPWTTRQDYRAPPL